MSKESHGHKKIKQQMGHGGVDRQQEATHLATGGQTEEAAASRVIWKANPQETKIKIMVTAPMAIS